jgi:DNA-binding MarR family transcriptional regulator
MPDASFERSWDKPGNAGENLEISQFPTFHILRLAGVARNSSMRRYVEPFGLSYPEWRMLTLISNFTPIAFGEITAKTLMDKGQVSRTLRALERKGFVMVDSGADRKTGVGGVNSRVVVSITPVGKSLYDTILPVARAHQAQVIDQLTLEERRSFLSVVAKLNRHLLDELAHK